MLKMRVGRESARALRTLKLAEYAGDEVCDADVLAPSTAEGGGEMFGRSTRELWKEGRRIRGYSLADFLHGYLYGRWPYAYIGFAKGDRRVPLLLKPVLGILAKVLVGPALGTGVDAKREFADRYHGKVLPTDAAERLVTLDQPIELQDLEKIIPYAKARDIVLSDPDHLVVLECPCRAGTESPCLPLDVCLIVGEPFCSFIAEHHPQRSRWISQQEAVDILRAEHERGHVHHAFFKDAMLGRFYAICNCCSCCCGAMQATRNGTPMLASSGFIASAEATRCVACGRCAEACPFGALALVEGVIRIDVERCMGCGVCVSRCPTEGT
jgi:ferredoxin